MKKLQLWLINFLKDLTMKNFDHLIQQSQIQKNTTNELIRLIVLECAKVCDELSFSPEGPSHEAKYQRHLCAESIKRHFGVV